MEKQLGRWRRSSPSRWPRSCCRASSPGAGWWCSACPAGAADTEGVLPEAPAGRRDHHRPGRPAGQVHQPGQQLQPAGAGRHRRPADRAGHRPARQRARRGDLQRAAGQRPAGPAAQGTAPVTRRRPAGGARRVHQPGHLDHRRKVTGPAEAVVVVSGQPYVDKDSEKRTSRCVKIAEQFDRTGRSWWPAGGSAGGNVVSWSRRPGAVADHLHVDNANTVQGRSSPASPWCSGCTEKKAGQYGVGDNAASLLPRLPQ